MHLAALEFHGAGGEREQGVVLALADVEAGLERSADLADDDRSGLGGLAAVDLHAAELGVGVAAVLGRTLSFFMGHGGRLYAGGAGGKLEEVGKSDPDNPDLRLPSGAGKGAKYSKCACFFKPGGQRS